MIVSFEALYRRLGEIAHAKREAGRGAPVSTLRIARTHKTHCPAKHELTEDNVYIGRDGYVECVECKRIAYRRKVAKA